MQEHLALPKNLWVKLGANAGCRSDGASLAFREMISPQQENREFGAVCDLRRRNFGTDLHGQNTVNLSHGEIQHASRNLDMPMNKGKTPQTQQNHPQILLRRLIFQSVVGHARRA